MKDWMHKLPVIAVLAIGVIFIGAFLMFEGLRDMALALLDWFQEMGKWGILFYFGFYTLIVLFLVPAVIFTFGAGFVFGFWMGALVIAAAIATGSTMAFLIARYALGSNVSRKLMEHPKLNQLDKGMRVEGWKIVLLSRLVPGFPFKLSNYFFGITSISLRGFFFGNLAGVMPIMLVNVYIGSLAGDLTELVERDREPWELWLYGVGLVAAIGLIYYIRQIAQRAMNRAIKAEETREQERKNNRARPLPNENDSNQGRSQ